MQQLKSKSFNKGMREVAHGKYQELKAELMSIIGTTSEQTWYKYRDGQKKTLDVNLAAKIDAKFAEYGIKQPWGE